jgi:CheY-like chemotaxis protein/HPt (histidine-containing phosphotransfer) domain-containing protein
VLVVDDAETNRDLISRLLTNAGAQVETVEDGQQAVDFFVNPDGTIKDRGIDIVLMDMQMPVLDGYSATEQLCLAGLQAPIVAMTANSMVGDDNKCRRAGCSDYLSKPIDLDALLEMVLTWSADSITSHQRSAAQAAPDESLMKVEPAVKRQDDASSISRLPEDWLRQFAIDFVAKVHYQLPEIKQAFQSSDYAEVARKIHWMKGSGGTVGLSELTELAKSCEQAAQDADIQALTTGLDEIESYIGLLVDECGEELPEQVDDESSVARPVA